MKTLGEQMAVYCAYHQSTGNKAMHFVGVPAIVWGLVVALAVPGPWVVAGVAITPAHLVVAALLAYYLALDFALGVASALLFTVLLVSALQMTDAGTTQALTAAGVAFAGGWAFQLLGHGVCEKRRPALVDHLWQVFVAPIFLIGEVAFSLGFKKALQAEVEARVTAPPADGA